MIIWVLSFLEVMSEHDMENPDPNWVALVSGYGEGAIPPKLMHMFETIGEINRVYSDNVSTFIWYTDSKDASTAVAKCNGCEILGFNIKVVHPSCSQISDLDWDFVGLEGGEEQTSCVVEQTIKLIKKLGIADQEKVFSACSMPSPTPPPPIHGKPFFQPSPIPLSGPKTNLGYMPMYYSTSVPTIPPFSGTMAKGEVSFQRWRYEVRCLMDAQVPDYIILQAIRKSLRGTPADVLTRLGESAGPLSILSRFEDLYANVLSGEALLKKFYNEEMLPDEDVTTWGCRLEDILSEAVACGNVNETSMDTMLQEKFWSDLADERLKLATRSLVNTVGSFSNLCRETRKIEQELKEADSKKKKRPPAKTANAAAMVPSSQSSQEEILKMIKALTKKFDQLEQKVNRSQGQHSKGQQQQKPSPANLNPSQSGTNNQKDSRRCHRCGHFGHLKKGCVMDEADFLPNLNP